MLVCFPLFSISASIFNRERVKMAENLDFSDRQLGRLLGVSWRRVRQMADEGKIPQPVSGRFDGPACVCAVIALAKSDRQPTALEQANARRAEMSAAEAEMRLAERRRDLVAVDVATDALDRLLGVVVAELVGLPARVTRDMALRRKLEDEIHLARERMARALAAAAEAITTGRETADEADDE